MIDRRFVVFALVGGVNTAIDLAAFVALTQFFAAPPLAANVASYLLGASNSYLMNGLITFGMNARALASARRIGAFALVSAASVAFSTAVLAALLLILPELPAKLACTLATLGFNFTLSRLVVFRASANAPPR